MSIYIYIVTCTMSSEARAKFQTRGAAAVAYSRSELRRWIPFALWHQRFSHLAFRDQRLLLQPRRSLLFRVWPFIWVTKLDARLQIRTRPRGGSGFQITSRALVARRYGTYDDDETVVGPLLVNTGLPNLLMMFGLNTV